MPRLGASVTTLPFRGDRLREIRELSGLTQGQLADRCTAQGTPVSRFQVYRAESARNRPAMRFVQAVARALGAGIDDFMDSSVDSHTAKREASRGRQSPNSKADAA